MPCPKRSRNSAQHGNILFLILLAVVLFAALSYAVTSSTQGGGKNVSAEAARANAARYMQFATLLENIVNRMVMTGVPETSLKFNKYQAANGNANCDGNNSNCTVNSCDVFHPAGGGASPLKFEDIAFKPATYPETAGYLPKAGHVAFRQVIIPGIGTAEPELIMMIAGIDPATCNEINRSVGIQSNFTETSGLVEPEATSKPVQLLSGCFTYAGFNTTNTFGDEDARFSGQRTFCAPAEQYVPGYLFLFHVLRAR